ncbi:MAG: LytR family transcriptional regulator [Modestobacter sp.]|nr:LytR family transcriptional regulator [Modestobacter sp.]
MSFAILAGSGYAWASYQRFTSGLTQVDGIPGSSQPGGQDDGRAQNILLIGDDHRPANASPEELALLSTGQDGGSTNTDTMMVLHLPAAGGGAPTVISFPRDSWVDIPGFGKGKLNSAFAHGAANGGGDAGGIQLLVQTLQNLSGLSISHFVRVSLIGFYDIANVLGPIQVCLNRPARDPLSGTNLPAGISTLNAKQALSFVRQRHGLLRGDLDREVRQQYFLSAELHKVVSAGTLLNPGKQQQLLGAVSSALETDPGLDLLALADRFSSLSADAVTYATIPITGTPTITDANGNPVSIVSVDFAALPAFIDHILGTRAAASTSSAPGPAPSAPAPAVDPATVTVHVVNGTGRAGLAASNAAALAQLGFRTDAPTNGATRRTTTIAYPAGMQAQAQALVAYVPGASVVTDTAVRQVTLNLGTDGAQVSQTTAPAGPPSTPSASASPAQAFTTASCIN